jgi:hypothetical protein
MTCNQMIVLLDIRRGFDKSRHAGTLSDELIRLSREGLILKNKDDENDWVLSAKGEDLFEAWAMCARGLI